MDVAADLVFANLKMPATLAHPARPNPPAPAWKLGLCLWWLWAITASAAPLGRVSIESWDTDRGLPQNSVIAMAQTRDGYLWLGTMNGLVRFDGFGRPSSGASGVAFPVFNESNTPELRSGVIVKLFEDSRTNLWVATDSADVLVAGGGRVRRLELESGSREGRVASICEDRHGGVWLYTANGQLYRDQDGRLDHWLAGAEYASRCRVVMVDDSDRLWIATDWSLSARPLPEPGSTNLLSASPAPIGKLDYLLSSRAGGYWRLANGRIQYWKAGRLQRDLGSYPWQSWRTPVNAACEDAEGNLVVGTGGEGIFWFNSDGTSIELSSSRGGLSHNTILSLLFDREGNLWAGTDGGGLNRIRQQDFNLATGTDGYTVQSVCEDASQTLWIGYNGERIDALGKGRIEQYTNSQGLVDLSVRAVFADRQNRIWAGTVPGGLLQLQNGLFLRAPGWDQLGSAGETRAVTAIFQDRRSTLWVGTQGGLARWDGTNWNLLTTRDGLPANAIRALADDAEGNLWVGTQGGGLDRIQAGRHTVFTRASGLPSDNIAALCRDEGGRLWVGTSGGLARVWEGKCVSLAGRLDLAGGTIGYLLDDGRDNLWIGSNAGLMRAARADLNALADGLKASATVRAYGKTDGLPTQECSQGSQPATCRTTDGRLWFPTIKGLVWLDPRRSSMNRFPPPVIIEAVAISGRLQMTNTLASPPPALVTVPPGQESLEFYFTSLNLSAPSQGLIRYRLEGHENQWTEVSGTTRSARYPWLPPGHYWFRVTACNEDGVWNEAGASVAVAVLPPFWRTWWFVSVLTLLLLGGVVGSVHYISTQKLQRQLALMRQQEAIEQERSRIARDLHDQLGANLTQVALLGELAETDRNLPGEVAGHARQICATARDTTRALDEIVWTVNPSNDTLDGLVNYVCKYAQEYLALAGLKYRLETPPQLPATPISPELRHNVFLAAKEAVNNVVKHSGAATVWIRLDLAKESFRLEIADDGRGMSASDSAKGRNGLRNMRKRMEDVGGGFEAIPRTGGGTAIQLTAPLTPRG